MGEARLGECGEVRGDVQKLVERSARLLGRARQTHRLVHPVSKVKSTSFDVHNVSIKWFEDGVTNVAHNCVDRHLPKRANQTAIIWEGDDPSKSKHITYAELGRHVELFANVLKAQGVKKGDRVTIYLPMIPEAAYAMLACAHWRDPFGGVRRLLARGAGGPDHRRQIRDRHHRRRRLSGRPEGAAQSQRRCGTGKGGASRP